MEKVKIKKLYEDSKIPKRYYSDDAGADLFARLKTKNKVLIVPSNGIVKIGTGIAVEVPIGYQAKIASKSSLALKGLWMANSPIDAGYSGEVFAVLQNVSSTIKKIKNGEALGQIVFEKIITPQFEVVNEIRSGERKDNGFGSTNKK